jgi:hypothetical protein
MKRRPLSNTFEEDVTEFVVLLVAVLTILLKLIFNQTQALLSALKDCRENNKL